MQRTLKLIAWGAVLFAGVNLIPYTTTYAKDESNTFQSYCSMAQADAKLLGESLHGNLKELCR